MALKIKALGRAGGFCKLFLLSRAYVMRVHMQTDALGFENKKIKHKTK